MLLFSNVGNKMAYQDSVLPLEVKTRIFKGINYTTAEREELCSKFVEKYLKVNSETIEDFNKSFFFLEKGTDKKFLRHRQDPIIKKLSSRKKKELGLYALGKKSLKYNDFFPMHKLWKEYMIKYMDLIELKKQNWVNNWEHPSFDIVSFKLYRADYHGSIMTVLKSTCPSYIGKSGIIIMETKNCFKLIGIDNILRTVPKSLCIFQFKLDDFEFTFYGKNMQVRPAERSSKKMKTLYTSQLCCNFV